MADSARSLARQLARIEKNQRDKGSTPQLGTSSIEDGQISEYDLSGTLKQIIGKQVDGTNTTVQVNGPKPPAPMAPLVTPMTEAATVYWNGAWANGAVAPLDLARIDVHLVPNASVDPLTVAPSATITAQGWGEANFPVGAGTYRAALVARTTSGKFSTSELSQPFEVLELVVPEPSDGIAPTGAPAVLVTPGVGGTLNVAIEPPDNPDPITHYSLYVNGLWLMNTSATLVVVPADAAGARLSYDVDTAIKVSAWDLDGEGPLSSAKLGRPTQIDGFDVSDLTLSVKKFRTSTHQIY
jgi:hypothetical protein